MAVLKVNTLEYDLPAYKIYAIRAAKELGYSSKWESKIRDAQSETEVSRIMVQARKEYWNDKD